MFTHTNRHRRAPERRRSPVYLAAAALTAAALASLALAHGGHARPGLAADFTAPVSAAASLPVRDDRGAVASTQHTVAARQARTEARHARQRARAAAARRAAQAAAQQAPAAPAAVPVASGGTYDTAQLEALWEQAGGSPGTAAVAACIATAESGGDTGATHLDSTGQVDYGLWQIGNDPAALNPLTGAQVAVQMSSDGTNWSQWTTAASCGV